MPKLVFLDTTMVELVAVSQLVVVSLLVVSNQHVVVSLLAVAKLPVSLPAVASQLVVVSQAVVVSLLAVIPVAAARSDAAASAHGFEAFTKQRWLDVHNVVAVSQLAAVSQQADADAAGQLCLEDKPMVVD